MNHHAHEDSSQVSDLIYYTSLLHLFLCIQRKNCKSVYRSLSLSLLCALFPPSFLSSYKLDFCSEPQLLIKKKKKSRAADCVCTDVAEIHTDAPITVLIIHSLSLFLTLCPFLFLSLSLAHDISFFSFSLSLCFPVCLSLSHCLFISISLALFAPLLVSLSRPF